MGYYFFFAGLFFALMPLLLFSFAPPPPSRKGDPPIILFSIFGLCFAAIGYGHPPRKTPFSSVLRSGSL